jgi:hypothetical protein
MSNLRRVCAWILVGENNPSDTNYNDKNSCYQTLNTYGVYRALEMVNVCFFVTVPVANSPFYTIELGNKDVHYPSKTNPTRPTTQDYLRYVIRDAKAANPDMKFVATLGYNEGVLSNIFVKGQADAASARAFASNLVAYLAANELDGFDVDWEYPTTGSITTDQFTLLFTAIRKAFDASDRKYYLLLSPAGIGSMVGKTVSATVDWVNLQVYGGAQPSQYIEAGVNPALLAYGAKFESENAYSVGPHQSPQNAYAEYGAFPYSITTQWRLNSGNYQTEQAYQLVYSQLILGAGMSFDDTNVLGAAGSPPLTQIIVRSGDVVDALQATNTGSFTFNGQTVAVPYQLLQHGGDGGQSTAVEVPASDPITQLVTASGIWFGWRCLIQITFQSRSGKIYGPYGTAANAHDVTTTTWNNDGNALIGFKGELVNVPKAVGPNANVVATLTPIWSSAQA